MCVWMFFASFPGAPTVCVIPIVRVPQDPCCFPGQPKRLFCPSILRVCLDAGRGSGGNLPNCFVPPEADEAFLLTCIQ